MQKGQPKRRKRGSQARRDKFWAKEKRNYQASKTGAVKTGAVKKARVNKGWPEPPAGQATNPEPPTPSGSEGHATDVMSLTPWPASLEAPTCAFSDWFGCTGLAHDSGRSAEEKGK